MTEQIDLQRIYPDRKGEAIQALCLTESRLSIYVNERQLYQITCTAQDIEEMVCGRLFLDGIIQEPGDILCLRKNGESAYVTLSERAAADAADMLATAGCSRGGCGSTGSCADEGRLFEGSTQMQTMMPPAHIKAAEIFWLAGLFRQDDGLHGKTGGAHKCLLSYYDQNDRQQVYICEDIKRHNTIDKAVGFAVLHGLDRRRCMLFTSGRVPSDMAQKAIRSGIPVLISKAVPTAQAVALARAHGLTLICRAWQDSFDLYQYAGTAIE